MVIIKEVYDGSIEHLRNHITNVKKLSLENGFELISYKSDNSNIILERGIWKIMLETYELEKEIWLFMYKKNRPVYRLLIEKEDDLLPLIQFIKTKP